MTFALTIVMIIILRQFEEATAKNKLVWVLGKDDNKDNGIFSLKELLLHKPPQFFHCSKDKNSAEKLNDYAESKGVYLLLNRIPHGICQNLQLLI